MWECSQRTARSFGLVLRDFDQWNSSQFQRKINPVTDSIIWHLNNTRVLYRFVTLSIHKSMSCNKFWAKFTVPSLAYIIQDVPLATEPGWLADRCSVSQQLGALQTHSFSFLTQRMYSCSNFVAISSLVLELLKKCRVR